MMGLIVQDLVCVYQVKIVIKENVLVMKVMLEKNVKKLRHKDKKESMLKKQLLQD